jgi:hypothetical protein
VAIIPLAPALLPGSSDLPESCPIDGVGGAGAPPLLFGLAPCGVYPAPDITIGAVRSYPAEAGVPKQPAPFHPYQSSVSPRTAVCFLWHFPYRRRTVHLADIPPRPSLLASTLPCGVRTFLSLALGAVDPVRTRPAIRRGSDRPACPRKFHHRASRGSASRGERMLQLHRTARGRPHSWTGLRGLRCRTRDGVRRFAGESTRPVPCSPPSKSADQGH